MEVVLSSNRIRLDWASMEFVSNHPDFAQFMPEDLLPAAKPTVYFAVKNNIHPSLMHIAECLVTPSCDSRCRDWSMGTNPIKRGSHDQLLRYYV